MLVARARGLSLRIPRGDLRPLILTALINVTCWQVFSAFGLTLMAAGRASIIAFTMPLWASILSVVFLRERMTVLRIVGLALGLAALALLLIPEFGRMGGAPWGAAMMLAAAISWAAGTVMLKAIPWRMDTIQLAAWQLAIGGVPVIAASLLIGRPSSVLELTTPGAIGVVYAALIPMIYCHWAWFRIVALFPASIAAIGTLAIPVVGVFSSALILGEPLATADLLALALVVTGLFIVLVLPSLPPRRPQQF
jgi:drug/metabolite transporter (DMT)-like permease